MDDALLVCGRESARQLDRVVQSLPDRQRRPGHPVAKILSFEQLGDDVGRSVVAAKIMNGENAWMIQCRCRACLLLEAPETLVIVGERRRKYFDRDVASEPRIARPIDLAHSAGAKLRSDFVRAKSRS